MSNFFVRLAQRTLGQHDPVRPLTRSRYADPVLGEAPEEVVKERPVLPGAPEDPATPTATAPTADRKPDAASSPAMAATPVQRPAPAAAGRGARHRLDRPAPTEPASATKHTEAVSTSAKVANVAAERSAIQPRPKRPRPQASTDTSAPPLAPAEPPDPRRIRRRTPSDIEVQPVDSSGPDTSTRPPQHPLRTRVDTKTLAASTPNENPGPARARREGTNPSSSTAVAESVIEVHIGRIEVHASEPSAAAPVVGPNTPGLSLADYLEMRNGGRR
jgi:hypothetical protein